MVLTITPSFAGMIDHKRRKEIQDRKAPKPVIVIDEMQGSIILINIKDDQIVVRNLESEEDVTFMVNDKDLLLSLDKWDEVKITFNRGSNVAKDVSLVD